VFLVHHDQPQPRRRGEDGAAGPDDHLRLPAADLVVVESPLGGGKPRVQHRHPRQAAGEALERLRGQGDLRHQQDRLGALGQDPTDGAEVHFRLAAAGHPVQQHDRKAPAQPPRHRRQHLLLFGVEFEGVRDGLLGEFVQLPRAFLEADEPPSDEPAKRLG